MRMMIRFHVNECLAYNLIYYSSRYWKKYHNSLKGILRVKDVYVNIFKSLRFFPIMIIITNSRKYDLRKNAIVEISNWNLVYYEIVMQITQLEKFKRISKGAYTKLISLYPIQRLRSVKDYFKNIVYRQIDKERPICG